jgi:hypothetical protein
LFESRDSSSRRFPFEEIVSGERLVSEGKHPEQPFIILSQPSLFDPSRAPRGRHTLWGYCHVPNGSQIDMSERIEKQIERFAPGFRDCILARNVTGPVELESHNSNLVGGDINGGLQNLSQMFTRPTWRLYSTPNRHLYICSSSTPPGGGVHGLCGYYAAKVALIRFGSTKKQSSFKNHSSFKYDYFVLYRLPPQSPQGLTHLFPDGAARPPAYAQRLAHAWLYFLCPCACDLSFVDPCLTSSVSSSHNIVQGAF